ncbi:MAG: hypothetical protein WCO00_07220 [Rhodospirillaceae bacterium]
MALQIAPGMLDVIEFGGSGACFGSHSGVSQAHRAAMALREALLVWTGRFDP